MEDVTELWRPVVGFEGYYEVSDRGQVRSVARWIATKDHTTLVTGRLLKAWVDKRGYRQVCLSVEGRHKRHPIHQLVCEAFHGGRNPELMVRHLNGNPGDNRPSNLKWGTSRQNAQDTLRHGRNFQRSKTHCPRGHEYDEENTHLNKGQGRTCRACRRITDDPRNRPRRTATHCKNGHPWTDSNTYVSAQGYTKCRICHRQYQRELNQRKRQAS